MSKAKSPEEALEPEAILARDVGACSPIESLQLSIAISLKRIADSLQSQEGNHK